MRALLRHELRLFDATFFLSEDGVERYGKHSPDYEPVNFFGEGTLNRDD